MGVDGFKYFWTNFSTAVDSSNYLYNFLKNSDFIEQGLINFDQTLERLYFKEDFRNAEVDYKISLMDSMIVVHVRYLAPEVDFVDMTYTTWDKFANFGGNFGIFGEITGCTFLGMLNCFVLIFKYLASKAHSYLKRKIEKKMQERKMKKKMVKQEKIKQQSKV